MLLAHDVVGDGPTAVLLHSGVCDRRMWQPQLAALSAAYRVVVPDLRGYGESPLPGELFSHGDDLVTLLDHLDVQGAALVGSSLGGRVALETAVRWPEYVAGLVLLCPAFHGPEETAAATAFEETEEAMLAAGDVDGAVELNLRTWLGPEASEATRRLVREMQRHAFAVQLEAERQDQPPQLDTRDIDLSAITEPTLVVRGGRDMDHFQQVASVLADTIAGARLVDLPWACHLPSLERPEEVTALVADFLAELRG